MFRIMLYKLYSSKTFHNRATSKCCFTIASLTVQSRAALKGSSAYGCTP